MTSFTGVVMSEVAEYLMVRVLKILSNSKLVTVTPAVMKRGKESSSSMLCAEFCSYCSPSVGCKTYQAGTTIETLPEALNTVLGVKVTARLALESAMTVDSEMNEMLSGFSDTAKKLAI